MFAKSAFMLYIVLSASSAFLEVLKQLLQREPKSGYFQNDDNRMFFRNVGYLATYLNRLINPNAAPFVDIKYGILPCSLEEALKLIERIMDEQSKGGIVDDAVLFDLAPVRVTIISKLKEK